MHVVITWPPASSWLMGPSPRTTGRWMRRHWSRPRRTSQPCSKGRTRPGHELKHMSPSEKSAARFYGLPKVHKDHVTGEMPPLHPIISGSGRIKSGLLARSTRHTSRTPRICSATSRISATSQKAPSLRQSMCQPSTPTSRGRTLWRP